MALTQREAFARIMEHLCKHDGDAGHGYSQTNRWGNGTIETVDLGDGVKVCIAGGDRDCSSAIISALKALGINVHGATYTGNMRSALLQTGLFVWWGVGVAGKSAIRGDIYLNEGAHTAMCTSADPDKLCQFSKSETNGINGKTGDQTGQESNFRDYYNYPWNGKLHWKTDGATISGNIAGAYGTPGGSSASTTSGTTTSALGDLSYTGSMMVSEWQSQLSLNPDGKISNQSAWNRKQVLKNVEDSVFDGTLTGYGKSTMVVALQAKLGIEQDGQMGPATVGALQEWLKSKGYYHGQIDKVYGPATSTAVGNALLAGAFRG